jgi:epoxyqueuosine reductase
MKTKELIPFERELRAELTEQGTDFVYFVDISQLPDTQNKQYPVAILIGIVLSSNYIQKVLETPDYVQKMVLNNRIHDDEFYKKEVKADRIADSIAGYLIKRGYAAYSQSEKNILSTGYYNEKTKSTPLPHKTVAGLAGLGWIGKHNLLVTPQFGSAICMCTILTNAPLTTVLNPPLDSRCGDCSTCSDICPMNAIKGKPWSASSPRDERVDIYKCNTCLKCLVLCPWTLRYVKRMKKQSVG